jgi:hypothetical protein
MISEIENLINNYQHWLIDKTTIRQATKDWIEITTPYLDRHNDYLQIYIQKEGDSYLMTDDGFIITDLEQTGCQLDSKKRKDLLSLTLNGFGVQLKQNKLEVRATQANFSLKKHNLIQAMLAVNDLFYMAIPIVASLFLEDVTAWIERNEIRFVANIKLTGATGYDHVFDFVIPKTRSYPDRFIRAINKPSRETAESFAWAWVDTKEVRPESTAFAILNDIDSSVSPTITSALVSYNISPILWSNRNEHIESLVG